MKKLNILYCFAGNSVFGHRDIEMLSQTFNVDSCHYDVSGNIFSKGIKFIQYSFQVFRKVFGKSVIIINFGAWHTILPVILSWVMRKTSIVIVGGFDAGNIPSINYGLFHKSSVLLFFMQIVYKKATFLCPVSEALVKSTNFYADPSGQGYKIGLLNHISGLEDKIRIIPTDYDDGFWKPDLHISREGVISLAYIYNHQTYILKGFDLLLECAKLLPELQFTFAGFSPEMVSFYKEQMPANVKLLSFQNREEARSLFQQHQVFVMPSLTEGLPNTLCEAMLCGCIPIGSDVSVIPDIIGETGYIVYKKDPKLWKDQILIDIAKDKIELSGRERIIELYPNGLRKRLFNELINEQN